jgi:Na+/phosphate symporter
MIGLNALVTKAPTRGTFMPFSGPVKDQLDLFGAVVDNLAIMVEMARSAFNHQCRQVLAEMEHHKVIVEEEIALATERIDSLLSEISGKEQVGAIKLHSVLSHLQIVTEALSELVHPLRRQISEGVPFSPKACSQINELFKGHLEILRALADILKTDNEVLKAYISDDKGPQLCSQCIEYATDHEARLIEGLCTPHAAPLYLGMLDCLRVMAQHEISVAKLLQQISQMSEDAS